MKDMSSFLSRNPGLWDANKSLRENAKAFKTSYSNMMYLAKRNGLTYRKIYGTGYMKKYKVIQGSIKGRPRHPEEGKEEKIEKPWFAWDETSVLI